MVGNGRLSAGNGGTLRIMILRRTFVSLLAAVAATAVGARTAHGQASAVVLALPASARAAGGGDASAFSTDASALFYGAQHLPRERTVTVSAGTWIGGAQLASLAYSTMVRWQPRFRSVLAVGVQSLDFGSADEYVPDPLAGGTRGTATGSRVGAHELAATIGLRQQVARMRVGMAVTYVQQQVADARASAVMMSVADGVTVGGWDADLSLEHTGAPAGNPARPSLSLPSTMRGSVASPVWLLAGARWRGVAEVRRTNHEGSTSVVGAEGSFTSGAGWELQVRGAGLAYTDETVRAPWSVGGSARRGAWSLDYAYQGYGALGAVHRMGVTWRSHDPQGPSR